MQPEHLEQLIFGCCLQKPKVVEVPVVEDRSMGYLEPEFLLVHSNRIKGLAKPSFLGVASL